MTQETINSNLYIFTDAKGRKWDFTLDLSGAMRIDKSDFSAVCPEPFSVLEPDDKTYLRILTSNRILFPVIWAVIYPQAQELYDRSRFITDPPKDPATLASPTKEDARKWVEYVANSFPVSPKENMEGAEAEFYKAINGSNLEDAKERFWGAFTNFFQDAETALSVYRKQMQRGTNRLTEGLLKMEPEIEKATDAEVDQILETAKKMLGGKSGKLPESSN